MSDTSWSFAQKFCSGFQANCSELANRLEDIRSPQGFSSNALRGVAIDLANLTKSLSDATGSLPSYDQRQCELQLKALEKTLDDLRTSFSSKPKFAFKRKTAKPTSTTHCTGPENVKAQATTQNPALTITSRSLAYLTLADLSRPTSAEDQFEVSVSNIDRCIINLISSSGNRDHISALHVQGVSNSILLLPIIYGSIIFHELSNCVVVTGCHQFRMHGSTDVDVYLSIPSNPIIEHCARLRFTSYPKGIISVNDTEPSKHLSVQDFSHIRPTTPSPNWRVLSEEDSVSIWPVSKIDDQAHVQEELERLLPAREGGTERAS